MTRGLATQDKYRIIVTSLTELEMDIMCFIARGSLKQAFHLFPVFLNIIASLHKDRYTLLPLNTAQVGKAQNIIVVKGYALSHGLEQAAAGKAF